MANPFAKNPWRCDWSTASPMLAPLLGAARTLAKREQWPGLDDYNALLDPPVRNAGPVPLRFVAQGSRSGRMEDSYEARIYLKGEVQTRTENWHDFFNALVWITFPRTKAALNARHFEAMSLDPDNPARGDIRDALTLFDEGGVAVVCGNDDLAGLLRRHCWKELFVTRREDVTRQMAFTVFGHSLHEKALQPYIGFTGKGLLLKADADYFALSEPDRRQALDDMMSGRFAHGATPGTRDFTPVPLLGIPGWWPANQAPAFYDNVDYFRPKRIDT